MSKSFLLKLNYVPFNLSSTRFGSAMPDHYFFIIPGTLNSQIFKINDEKEPITVEDIEPPTHPDHHTLEDPIFKYLKFLLSHNGKLTLKFSFPLQF